MDELNLPASINELNCGVLKQSTSVGHWFVDHQKVRRPTETMSRSESTAGGCVTLVREAGASEQLTHAAARVHHPNLISARAIETHRTPNGDSLMAQRLALQQIPPFAQRSAGFPARAVELLLAVARALSHLHALEISHGAITIDNVFLGPRGCLLGPTTCGRSSLAADVQDLAELIDRDLLSIVSETKDYELLHAARGLAGPDGSAAAVAVSIERGGPISWITADDAPLAPRLCNSSGDVRCDSRGPIAFIACSPHVLPRRGAIVLQSQLSRFGEITYPNAAGIARVCRGPEPLCVVSARLHNGVALIGGHVNLDAEGSHGDASAVIERQHLRVQWFWPIDPMCTTMRVQIRRDRFPRPGCDAEAIETICQRRRYDIRRHWSFVLPAGWKRAFVRISHCVAGDQSNRHACFASTESGR